MSPPDPPEDEYAAYDLSEFTAEDLAAIDALAAEPQLQLGGPRISIELECATDAFSDSIKGKGKEKKKVVSPSPFQRYRRNNYLSVTDLVSPSWCEVQFDYGLRQGRSRKVEDRPASFTSAKGKTITVKQKVAVRNDIIQKRGKRVHKKLEREVRPEEVKVDINVEEERWALRLVNMISCLDSLMELGLCREMPIFGIMHDQVIIGIMDEVTRKPIPEPDLSLSPSAKRPSPSTHGTPKKAKKQHTPSSIPSAQHSITSFFLPSETTSHAHHRPPPSHTLYISDTKTRRSDTLPSVADAQPSRLQLMLYHRLLSALLSPVFPFADLWRRLNVDPFAPLSQRFLTQSGLMPDTPDGVIGGFPSCLDDLEDVWRTAVEMLHVNGVASELTVVYRAQRRRKAKAKDAGGGSASPASDTDAPSKEDHEVAQAMELSLLTAGADPDLQQAIFASLQTPSAVVRDGDLLSILRDFAADKPSAEAVERASSEPLPVNVSTQVDFSMDQVAHSQDVVGVSNRPLSPPVPAKSDILGTRTFSMNLLLLHVHVGDILRWWHGERLPQGVDIEHSGRCFSCEYHDDCEWRESKAAEMALRSKHKGSESRSPSVGAGTTSAGL